MSTRLAVTFAICLGAVVLATGCRKRSTIQPVSAPATEAAPTVGAPSPSAPPAAGSATSGPAPALVTTRESNDANYIQEMTQTLNDFLADYIREKKRVPKDINEMVSLKLITSIPVLPGGKKWVINQQTGKISAQ
jgi:hypothetical protein